MIPPAFVHELLSRTDIVEIVGRSVELKRAGAGSWKGLCPFHGEKTPSFTVNAQRQTYHCFGCGVHGNAIGFLMERQGLGFIDAVHELARGAGLQVPEDTRSDAERAADVAHKAREATLAETLGKAAEWYRKQLKASPRAIEYLKGRGLSGAVAAKWGLGYAPEGWRGLASAFPDYEDPLLAEGGLVIVKDDGTADGHGAADESAAPRGRRYDRFRDRVMFPIRSVQGEVIGFGGRVLDRGEPKYLNSPETPIFHKGRELYGLFEARTDMRRRGYALVVEGYMDVVALDQHGFGNAVATLGTACTAEHVQKLARFTDHVVFSFDGDGAGRRAAARALEAALPHVSDTRRYGFLFLPPEHDPDSYVRELGAEAFEAAVAGAVPLSKQLVAQAAEGADFDTAEGRAAFLAAARPLFSALPDGMLKRQLLGDIAARAGMAADELADAWRTVARGAGGRSSGDERRRASAGSGGFESGGGRHHRRDGPGWSAARPTGRLGRARVKQPVDRVAWMLLLHGDWWESLTAIDHATLCAWSGWHGEWFRFLDRHLAEHGAERWAALRERLVGEPWGAEAIALVDAEDAAIEPVPEDLPLAVGQLRRAPLQREAERILRRS